MISKIRISVKIWNSSCSVWKLDLYSCQEPYWLESLSCRAVCYLPLSLPLSLPPSLLCFYSCTHVQYSPCLRGRGFGKSRRPYNTFFSKWELQQSVEKTSSFLSWDWQTVCSQSLPFFFCSSYYFLLVFLPSTLNLKTV